MCRLIIEELGPPAVAKMPHIRNFLTRIRHINSLNRRFRWGTLAPTKTVGTRGFSA